MNKVIKKIATVGVSALVALGALMTMTVPAFAEPAGDATAGGDDGNCVKTSILGSGGQYCDDGDGGGIFYILGIVLNVLTYGVAIAATVGIVISGIQYSTAGDNVGQLQKAKSRIVQIVIGLAIYSVFWGLLQFLLPGGLFGDGT